MTSKVTRNRMKHRLPVTMLEDLSTEILFDIFDYLSANQMKKSFFGLNKRFDDLIRSKPLILLDLSRPKSKFNRTWQNSVRFEHVTALVIHYKEKELLINFVECECVRNLRAISLLQVSVRAFEREIPQLLNMFRNQLTKFRITFSDMKYSGVGEGINQSFRFLLCELPSLKCLALEYEYGVDPITYIDSTFTNISVTSLTLSINNTQRLVSLLWHFQNLKHLHLISFTEKLTKRAAPPTERILFLDRLHQKTVIDYPLRIRHIKIFDLSLTLDRVEQLMKIVIVPSLLTLELINCKRINVPRPIPRRLPPLLDGTEWHELLNSHLLVTMKKFSIDYGDVDNSMSLMNIKKAKRILMEYNRLPVNWTTTISYDTSTQHLFFHFTSIQHHKGTDDQSDEMK